MGSELIVSRRVQQHQYNKPKEKVLHDLELSESLKQVAACKPHSVVETARHMNQMEGQGGMIEKNLMSQVVEG